MGNTEIITLEGQEFKVFRKLPVPIAREVQKNLINMIGDGFEGSMEDFESGKAKAKDMKNIDINVLYEVYDLLLTKAVLSPKIELKDIQNIEHELQPFFEDLSELLLEKYHKEKKKIKKKSMNSPS